MSKKRKRYRLTAIKLKKNGNKRLFVLKSNNKDYLFSVAGVLGVKFGVYIDDLDIISDSPEIYSNF